MAVREKIEMRNTTPYPLQSVPDEEVHKATDSGPDALIELCPHLSRRQAAIICAKESVRRNMGKNFTDTMGKSIYKPNPGNVRRGLLPEVWVPFPPAKVREKAIEKEQESKIQNGMGKTKAFTDNYNEYRAKVEFTMRLRYLTASKLYSMFRFIGLRKFIHATKSVVFIQRFFRKKREDKRFWQAFQKVADLQCELKQHAIFRLKRWVFIVGYAIKVQRAWRRCTFRFQVSAIIGETKKRMTYGVFLKKILRNHYEHKRCKLILEKLGSLRCNNPIKSTVRKYAAMKFVKKSYERQGMILNDHDAKPAYWTKTYQAACFLQMGIRTYLCQKLLLNLKPKKLLYDFTPDELLKIQMEKEKDVREGITRERHRQWRECYKDMKLYELEYSSNMENLLSKKKKDLEFSDLPEKMAKEWFDRFNTAKKWDQGWKKSIERGRNHPHLYNLSYKMNHRGAHRSDFAHFQALKSAAQNIDDSKMSQAEYELEKRKLRLERRIERRECESIPWKNTEVFDGILTLETDAIKSSLAFDHAFRNGDFEKLSALENNEKIKHLTELTGDQGVGGMLDEYLIRQGLKNPKWIATPNRKGGVNEEHPPSLKEMMGKAKNMNTGGKSNDNYMQMDGLGFNSDGFKVNEDPLDIVSNWSEERHKDFQDLEKVLKQEGKAASKPAVGNIKSGSSKAPGVVKDEHHHYYTSELRDPRTGSRIGNIGTTSSPEKAIDTGLHNEHEPYFGKGDSQLPKASFSIHMSELGVMNFEGDGALEKSGKSLTKNSKTGNSSSSSSGSSSSSSSSGSSSSSSENKSNSSSSGSSSSSKPN